MSNRLPILSEQIQTAHRDSEQATAFAAQRALDAGRALLEAKDLVKHGEWLPFLASAGVHERTAQRYMKIARAGFNSDFVSGLGGIVPALKFLRLRELAMDQLTEAETASREGREGYDELVPLETFCLLVEQMVQMFPAEWLEH